MENQGSTGATPGAAARITINVARNYRAGDITITEAWLWTHFDLGHRLAPGEVPERDELALDLAIVRERILRDAVVEIPDGVAFELVDRGSEQ